GSASDTPFTDAGIVNQAALLALLEAALKVVWSDQHEQLPTAEDAAGLGESSEAARAFRSVFIRLWTATNVFEVPKSEAAESGLAVKSTLAMRAMNGFLPYRGSSVAIRKRESWRRVHQAHAAWWRPHVDDDGEVCIRLAMRWELAGQVKLDLPGVSDQASLT